jgi:parvulin-like peptidyl-prolyl isomerase
MATRNTKSTKSAKTTRPTEKAAPKKTTPLRANRKTASSGAKPQAQSVQATTSQPATTQSRHRFPAIKVRRAYLITAVVIIALLALAFFFRSLFIVAIVNGQPITRLAYINELEQTAGKQAMNSLVTKTLILQEAKKNNVTVSQKEVDDQIKTIQDNLAKQGQQLDSVLALQGMTQASLREQIYLQKLVEKMVGKNITVSDKEIADYIDKNKDSLPQNTSEADLKKQVHDQLYQQKLNDKVQTWIQGLQQKAKVSYLISQ